MARKNVSAGEVREWLRSDAGQAALTNAGVKTEVGSRGKHNPEQVEVFHKANKGKVYEAKVAEAPTVTVPVVTIDKAGRKRTIEQTITTAEARDLLGRPRDQRGRLPRADLSLALSAQHADSVADKFSADA